MPDEELEDVVLLIRRDSVAVYCSHNAWESSVGRVVAAWRNVRLVVTHLQSDADECEDLKVAAFLDFVKGCHRLGLPLAGKNFHEIEIWPLVSAFAVEGVGESNDFPSPLKQGI